MQNEFQTNSLVDSNYILSYPPAQEESHEKYATYRKAFNWS
jgi:hypothetical protein